MSAKFIGNENEDILFYGDGTPINNKSYLKRLSSLAESSQIEEDNYSLGGSVSELETFMSTLLGKEESVFMPTGTLANHLAIRKLAGIRKRVFVPEQSHIYQDSGDTLQNLSGINLVPLGVGRPYFNLDELTESLEKAKIRRVENPLGAVVIESPVRRSQGRIMPFDEMKEITDFCREKKIGTHLDGARLFLMSAATGISPKKYAQLFDTVYVSLWKYFGAPFGAIIAGSQEFCRGMHHERRMFGGGLPSASLAAALALDGSKNFLQKQIKAMEVGRNLFKKLNTNKLISIIEIPNGSNIFEMRVSPEVDMDRFYSYLSAQGIQMPANTNQSKNFLININPTVLNKSVSKMENIFSSGLEQSCQSN